MNDSSGKYVIVSSAYCACKKWDAIGLKLANTNPFKNVSIGPSALEASDLVSNTTFMTYQEPSANGVEQVYSVEENLSIIRWEQEEIPQD
jgi:hypothetical protein